MTMCRPKDRFWFKSLMLDNPQLYYLSKNYFRKKMSN